MSPWLTGFMNDPFAATIQKNRPIIKFWGTSFFLQWQYPSRLVWTLPVKIEGIILTSSLKGHLCRFCCIKVVMNDILKHFCLNNFLHQH